MQVCSLLSVYVHMQAHRSASEMEARKLGQEVLGPDFAETESLGDRY